MDVKPYKIPHPFRKLNIELIDKIVFDISEGSTHKYAAESNGITETIFNIWRRQGMCDMEHEQDSLCSYLVVSLAKIKQEEVIHCRKSIKFDERGHKGAEWTLEHAYQRDFSNSEALRELAQEIDEIKEAIHSKSKSESEQDNQSL